MRSRILPRERSISIDGFVTQHNNKSKVLVTGGTGFVGRAVCRRLLADGANVIVSVRGESHAVEPGCEHVAVGDINGGTEWQAALRDVQVIVHLAARTHSPDTPHALAEYRAINTDGTRGLIQAAATADVQRFVFMSSIKVNGEGTSPDRSGGIKRYRSDDAVLPTSDYGRTKWEAEKVIAEVTNDAKLGSVILRPPLVYGPGQKGNMLQLMRIIDRGIPLPFAKVTNSRSLIYVDNLADAVVCAVRAKNPGTETFTLADTEVSTTELIQAIARGLGKRPNLFFFPVSLLKIAARIAGKGEQLDKLVGSLVVDSSRISNELGWSPRYSFEQAMRKTVLWYRRGRGA